MHIWFLAQQLRTFNSVAYSGPPGGNRANGQHINKEKRRTETGPGQSCSVPFRGLALTPVPVFEPAVSVPVSLSTVFFRRHCACVCGRVLCFHSASLVDAGGAKQSRQKLDRLGPRQGTGPGPLGLPANHTLAVRPCPKASLKRLQGNG